MRIPCNNAVSCFIAAAGIAVVSGPAHAQPPKGWVHPGVYNNGEELATIAYMVQNKKNPIYAGYRKMMEHDGYSDMPGDIRKLDYKSNFKLCFCDDNYTCRKKGLKPEKHRIYEDATACYNHAYQWLITGEKAHAEKVIELINTWAYKQTKWCITGVPHLHWGMSMANICNAAEIVRYTYNGWKDGDYGQFRKWLSTIVWPHLADLKRCKSNCQQGCRHPKVDQLKVNNRELLGTVALLAMAVCLEDAKKWDFAVKAFRESLDYAYLESGQTQEACRDWAHDMMGAYALTRGCEMCWKQGVDVYSDLKDGQGVPRLLKGLRYTVLYVNGTAQKAVCYSGCSNSNPAGKVVTEMIKENGYGKSNTYALWEMAYNHYHHRLGMKVPLLKKMRDLGAPEGVILGNMMWGTLTHGDIDSVKNSVPDLAARTKKLLTGGAETGTAPFPSPRAFHAGTAFPGRYYSLRGRRFPTARARPARGIVISTTDRRAFTIVPPGIR